MTPAGSAPPRVAFGDETFTATANAYASVPDSWERGIQAAIAALFEFLAERPADTEACLVNDGNGGPDSLDRRDQTIGRFVALLQPGFATAPSPPPPIVAQAIAGGIYELIRRHAIDRRLDELPRAAGDATLVALTPFMGADRAAELALSAPRSWGRLR